MDTIDRQILGVLAEDARISMTDLAEGVGLSLSATSERFRRLVADGVVTRFRTEFSPAALGRTLEAIVDIKTEPGQAFHALDAELAALPEIIDAVHLTGSFGYQLRVSCADVDNLQRLLAYLSEELGVIETSTRLVLARLAGFPRSLPTGGR